MHTDEVLSYSSTRDIVFSLAIHKLDTNTLTHRSQENP